MPQATCASMELAPRLLLFQKSPSSPKVCLYKISDWLRVGSDTIPFVAIAGHAIGISDLDIFGTAVTVISGVSAGTEVAFISRVIFARIAGVAPRARSEGVRLLRSVFGYRGLSRSIGNLSHQLILGAIAVINEIAVIVGMLDVGFRDSFSRLLHQFIKQSHNIVYPINA